MQDAREFTKLGIHISEHSVELRNRAHVRCLSGVRWVVEVKRSQTEEEAEAEAEAAGPT